MLATRFHACGLVCVPLLSTCVGCLAVRNRRGNRAQLLGGLVIGLASAAAATSAGRDGLKELTPSVPRRGASTFASGQVAPMWGARGAKGGRQGNSEPGSSPSPCTRRTARSRRACKPYAPAAAVSHSSPRREGRRADCGPPERRRRAVRWPGRRGRVCRGDRARTRPGATSPRGRSPGCPGSCAARSGWRARRTPTWTRQSAAP